MISLKHKPVQNQAIDPKSSSSFRFSEAFKSLRTNLEFLSTTQNCQIFLITSSIPGEGKSNVAINLAQTMASSGKKVLLVDCDLRKASLSRYLNVARSHAGITNLLAQTAELTDTFVSFSNLDFFLLPVGAIPPNPSEILASKEFTDIFSVIRQAFDFIILDTPPVTVVTDAAVLCGVADGVLVVVRSNVATIETVQLCKKNLLAVNARILGVILNGYSVKKTNKHDAYYYTYSYDYYGHIDTAGKTIHKA